MKKLIKIFLLTCLTAGIFNFAEAQRRNGDSHNREGRRGNDGGSSVRTFPQRNVERRMPQNNPPVVRTVPHRDIVSRQNYSRPYSAPRNNYRYPGNYHYNNYYRNNYYRTTYSYRPAFMYGPRYTIIPRNSISIYFGGVPYYYNAGFFYGYYGGYYEPIFPPIGIRIRSLPFGYTRFFIGINPFFYYNGIYYRQYDDKTYEVVDAPMGATVSALPKGAKSVVINGEKLYELNGTYYKADRDSKGNEVYTVVGKNGVIDNTDENHNGINTLPESLQIGDVINQLPEGARVVTINGEKMYVTPDDTYLKEETIDGVVQYRVVGK